MLKGIKIVLLALVGLSFVIATLEIDVLDYDNTFFDTYDSYIQVDNQVVHQNNIVEQGSIAFPAISLSSLPTFVIQQCKYDESLLPPHFYELRLYIVQSSLLI